MKKQSINVPSTEMLNKIKIAVQQLQGFKWLPPNSNPMNWRSKYALAGNIQYPNGLNPPFKFNLYSSYMDEDELKGVMGELRKKL